MSRRFNDFERGVICGVLLCSTLFLSYWIAVSVQDEPILIGIASALSSPFIRIGSFDINIPDSTHAYIGCYWANALSVCDGFGYQDIPVADARALLVGRAVYIRIENDTAPWPTYQHFLLRRVENAPVVLKLPNDHVWTTWLEGTPAPPRAAVQTVLFLTLMVTVGCTIGAVLLVHDRYVRKKHEESRS